MVNNYCLYNTDCLNAMKKMEHDSIDLVWTHHASHLGLFMKNWATNFVAL